MKTLRTLFEEVDFDEVAVSFEGLDQTFSALTEQINLELPEEVTEDDLSALQGNMNGFVGYRSDNTIIVGLLGTEVLSCKNWKTIFCQYLGRLGTPGNICMGWR